jgi:hypothetical protein
MCYGAEVAVCCQIKTKQINTVWEESIVLKVLILLVHITNRIKVSFYKKLHNEWRCTAILQLLCGMPTDKNLIDM